MRIGKLMALLMVLALVFGTRLYFGVSTQNFSDTQSYYVLRQTENIKDTGMPLVYDSLSYGGKHLPILPAYYYLLAGASFLGDLFAYQILPAIIASLISIVAYMIASEFTKEWRLAAIAGFLAGFVPAFFSLTINSLCIEGITTLLVFLCVLFVIKLEKSKKALPGAIICSVLLTLVSPFSIGLLLVLWAYMGFIKLQGIRIQTKSFEFMLFFTFFALLINQLAFARAGLESGLLGILSTAASSNLYAPALNWVNLIAGANGLVLILGVLGIYLAVKQEARRRAVSLLLALSIVTLIMGSLKLIPINLLLSIVGIVLAIASVNSLVLLFNFLDKVRFGRSSLAIALTIIVMAPAFAFGFYGGAMKTEVSQADIDALIWLAENKPHGTVIAPTEYGHLIAYFSGNANVADLNTINSPEAYQRQEDIRKAYVAPFETEAISVFDKYDVKYIFLNLAILSKYNISKLSYSNDFNCFEHIYSKGADIFEVKCKLN